MSPFVQRGFAAIDDISGLVLLAAHCRASVEIAERRGFPRTAHVYRIEAMAVQAEAERRLADLRRTIAEHV